MIFESEGHARVSNHPLLIGEMCHGCECEFGLDDVFEALVDRVRKRSYLIHEGCWELLSAKIQGGSNGNLPAWAQF